MKYSKRETFFWLKGAALLDRTHILTQCLEQVDQETQKEFLAGKKPNELLTKLNALTKTKEYAHEIRRVVAANPQEIRDYCKVRQSLNKARTILISLGKREVSIDELDKGKNETSGMTYDIYPAGFHVSVRKAELSRIAATGAKGNDEWWIKEGIITKADIRIARKRKRRPLCEIERVSIVARFLIEHWCGQAWCYGMWKNWFETLDKKLSDMVGVVRDNESYVCKKSPSFFFMPPLCFFSNDALAMFVPFALGKKQSDRETSSIAIRKWVSRLELKHAGHPKIRETQIVGDKIYFLR
jgi:hypothetical protein